MRKLSLNDGRLSLDIIPDCGGGVSSLRWMTPTGNPFDFLRAPREQNASDPGGMAYLPLLSMGNGGALGPGGPWMVQDASNVRATLTWHHEDARHIYQFLQRFELGPKGLQVLMTLTNIGVQPLLAGIGLRMRLTRQAEMTVQGALTPAEAGCAVTAGQLAQGYSLCDSNARLCLMPLAKVMTLGWPLQQIALKLEPDSGFGFLDMDGGDQKEIALTWRSHRAGMELSQLKQGDSLSARLICAAHAL